LTPYNQEPIGSLPRKKHSTQSYMHADKPE